MNIVKKTVQPVLFLIFIAALFVCCDNTIDPFIGGKVPYSVYGYLEAGRDTNFIRVAELDRPLLADSTQKLDVKKVTLTNLKNGVQQALQDSVIRFDSVYTHNFYTTLDIMPGITYKLKVEGPEGELTVSTKVPAVATPAIYTNRKRYPYIDRGRFPDSVSCAPNIRVSFHPVDPESAFRVFYPVNDFYCNRHVINKQGEQEQKRVIDVCANNPDGRMTFEVHHYSTDTFKPIRPTDSLKVPGGAGFFGSFYKKTFTVNYDNKPDSIFNFLPPCPACNEPFCRTLYYGTMTLCPVPLPC